jgi:hypothetical protein
MEKSFYLILIILLFNACKKEEGCMEPLAENYNAEARIDDGSCIYSNDLILNFTHNVNGLQLMLGGGCASGSCFEDHSCCDTSKPYPSMPYTTNNTPYNIQRLWYILSEIKLHKDNGEYILLKEFHFVNAESQNTLTYNAGTISNGNYTSISYTMGLNNLMNVSNTYVNEDFHASMFWPEFLGGGYHYMKLEGAYNFDSTFYNTHTGALGTSNNDPDRIDNSFTKTEEISLIIDEFHISTNIDFNMNIHNWYNNPNVISLESSIMGNSAIQSQLQENGMQDVFSISVNTIVQ